MDRSSISTHAETAKSIRKELKQHFPTVKFSVKSKSYSGGCSVDINWNNGPTCKAVHSLVDKYQYGHFDGMIDCYEITNHRNDIPQVKYVFCQRYVEESIKEAIFKELQVTHSGFKDMLSMDEHSSTFMKDYGVWRPRDYIYRLLVNKDLTDGYKAKDLSEYYNYQVNNLGSCGDSVHAPHKEI